MILQLIEELDFIPITYLKKLVNTAELWEVRVQASNNIFRLLGFFEGDNLIVLNHGFQKKTQKTPSKDAKIIYRGKAMSDLQAYIAKRKAKGSEFASEYDEGYQNLRFGTMLKVARKESGITQAALAEMLDTQKSAISRIENHADDVKLSTLERIASALGKKVEIRLV